MTVIVARTTALSQFPLDQALDRIKTYSQTGADAIRLAGLKTRDQLEAVHRATPLPLTVLSPPDGMMNDIPFLAANGVSIVMAGNSGFGMAIQAIYDSFKHLKEGGSGEDLAPRDANAELLRQIQPHRRVHQAAGTVPARLALYAALSIGHSLWADPPMIQPRSSSESQSRAVAAICNWPAYPPSRDDGKLEPHMIRCGVKA